MEERTSVVEGEIEALRAQTTTHEGQLTDIMWKLEDQENRQRRNNFRFLGIKEEASGAGGDVGRSSLVEEPRLRPGACAGGVACAGAAPGCGKVLVLLKLPRGSCRRCGAGAAPGRPGR
ncbi:hypothetical protein NDU88_006591 [Pleurodeles waltl]|uniref:Uncharacterized protein n=1 Tax=Pleurodeles waltl TaxID=8319 RepID=A0AAV7WYP2_PLEWA|nr:hypothetical protein NDU88_006591 [Pleurodeles waltl]